MSKLNQQVTWKPFIPIPKSHQKPLRHTWGQNWCHLSTCISKFIQKKTLCVISPVGTNFNANIFIKNLRHPLPYYGYHGTLADLAHTNVEYLI